MRTISRKGSNNTYFQLTLEKIAPEIGHYLAGFADGEGSFNVSFRPRPDYRFPWKISLCFNISQRDPAVLRIFQSVLDCGTMRQRNDGVWYFEVNDFTSINTKVIPYFDRFGFLSEKKKRDFNRFKSIAAVISRRMHITNDGLKEILLHRSDMNDGGKRRYTDEYIINLLENPQRLNAKLAHASG